MPHHGPFYQWRAIIATHMPNLSKPQVSVLALWTWGMVCTRCSSLTTVAVFLSLYFECPLNTMRQRLREFYWEANAKAGPHRQALDVGTCFAPLLRWTLQGWPNRQLPIALDASTLGEKFVVLAISVVYRSCAIPVAWKILPATLSTPLERRVVEIARAVPGSRASKLDGHGPDRPGPVGAVAVPGHCGFGLAPVHAYQQWWQLPSRWTGSIPYLEKLCATVGTRWRGRGTAFSTPNRQVDATLLAWWGPGYEEPWLILTDLTPEASEADWYGLRAWIEQGFKDYKRGGLQWQHTRMSDPGPGRAIVAGYGCSNAVAVACWWGSGTEGL